MFTSSVKNSVSRNTPDGAIRDEVIALAIAEERSAADGVLQATEFLTDEVNTAKYRTLEKYTAGMTL